MIASKSSFPVKCFSVSDFIKLSGLSDQFLVDTIFF